VSRLTEKQLLFLTIGIAVLLTGGLGFLIWSDLKTIDEEQMAIEDLKKQIGSAEREIDLIPQREYRVIANREIADKEVAFLPEEEEIENFWEVLERFAAESGVRISEIAPSSVGQTRGKKKGETTTISSVPQVLSLRGTIDELLRFINLIENYDRIINVVEFSIGSGEVADEDGMVRHGIRLALTTFTYSKKIASTIVSIPKYEEKKENPEVKKWLSRIKIQEKETYTLQPALGRRDPFVSIRKRPAISTGPGADDVNRPNQIAMIENLIGALAVLNEGLDYEEELQKRGDLWRLQAQKKENRDLYRQLSDEIPLAQKEITFPDLQDQLKREVLAPWAEIQKRIEAIVQGNPKLTRDQVNEWLNRVQTLFDEKQWADVESQVRQFSDASRKGQHVQEDAKDLVQKIFDMQRSAKVIQAFEKKSIKISTILYSPNGMSVAVINGRQMSEGDALDEQGTIIVVEIGENYVIFETEGVEIKRGQNDDTNK